MTKEQPPWRLRADDPPDEATARALSAFLMRVQASRWVPKELANLTSWKLRENPVHPGFATSMVTTPGDRVVSLCTVTPKRLWWGGSEHRWAEIGDTFTDPDFQRKGMFATVTDASRSRAQAAGFSIVYGLPNEQSLPPYEKKLDFAVKADVEQLEWLVPLSTRVLASPLVTRGHPRLAGLASGVVAASWSRALLGMLLPKRSGAITVAEERTFGDEYDALWREMRSHLPVAQVRDARHLDWRYRANPFAFELLAAREGGQLRGYVVVLSPPTHDDSGLRRLYVMDWLFAPDQTDVARALLRAVFRRALDGGNDVVTAHGARRSPIHLPFPRGLTVTRPFGKPVIIHKSEVGRRLVADPSPWHLTLGDSDAF